MTEAFRCITRRPGVDVGFHNNIQPINGEGVTGKNNGINKNFTFEMVLEIAYKIEPSKRPNIIVKAGKKAMWYLKKVPVEEIENRIKKEEEGMRGKNGGLKHFQMYIIEWE